MVNQLTRLRKVSQTFAYNIIFMGACPNQSMKKTIVTMVKQLALNYKQPSHDK
jgi:hypothetical protein